MKARLALTFLLGSVACGKSLAAVPPPPRLRPDEDPRPPQVATASEAGPVAPAPHVPCAALSAAADRYPSPESEEDRAAGLPFGTCFPGARGAWQLGWSREPRALVVLHEDERGVITERRRALVQDGHQSGTDAPSVPPFGWIDEAWAETFDFDGDGEPELFVGIHGIWSNATGLELAESALYTFHGGAVVPYPPAARFGIWKLEDRDHDGRPDLLTSSPYARSRGGSTPVFSPTLVAHSLPDGTFSTTDEVAAAAARVACPRKPPLASVRRPAPPHREEDDERLACARMWGVPVAEIAARLGLSPKSPDWPEVLSVEPPLTLK